MNLSPRCAASVVIFSMSSVFCGAQVSEPEGLAEIMPVSEDFTSMWWKEGFPSVVEGASWVRKIQTGYYSVGLDTSTMRFTEFGPVAGGGDYDSFAISGVGEKGTEGRADLELTISANGKDYRCVEGGEATRYGGPRLVESGRFFQRGDVTHLVFAAEDGERLNVEGRFEMAGWPEDLGMIMYARPGVRGIAVGEASFGKVGGGFGLDGTNDFVVPNAPWLDGESFTLGLWFYAPVDFAVTERGSPWLVCKGRHEGVNGNYGIFLNGGKPEARMNIGGKEEGSRFVAESSSELNTNRWNHVAMSYDGDVLCVFLNGKKTGEQKVGKVRAGTNTPLVFGRRGSNDGTDDRYRVRGVIDEVLMYDQALDEVQIRDLFRQPGKGLASLVPTGKWGFEGSGQASEFPPREDWKAASIRVGLSAENGALNISSEWSLPKGEVWVADEWKKVSLSVKPGSFEKIKGGSSIGLKVKNKKGGGAVPVRYDDSLNCHRIDISKVRAISPPGEKGRSNDAIERIKVVLKNPENTNQVARLIFEKPNGGIGNGIGGITGITAMFRDRDGKPTGIPVQISKNWHNDKQAGVYSGSWFRAISQLRLPPGSRNELELTICYGHWGGVAAASHAQLSLIGWGSNQHWSQSAVGSWGESICYEPGQGQAGCTITDVRPLMVNGGKDDKKWEWTSNVGGGDFFRFFDSSGKRIVHSAMQTAYHKHGPCLSEVTFAGKIGDGIRHSSTVSVGRSDDLVKGIYRVRLDVDKGMDFSRFVIFQVGADTYNFTQEKKLAVGNISGLVKEWDATWGGSVYHTEPFECVGEMPWVSMHEGDAPAGKEIKGAWANRGVVVRSWEAKIGGKKAAPFIAEYGSKRGLQTSSSVDFVVPPGTIRLEPGDFIEATFEHIIMPQSAEEYYGPNEALRKALQSDGNTWEMIRREAVGNNRKVKVLQGSLERSYPDIRIKVDEGKAEFTVSGGLGYVPVTFTGLKKYRDYTLLVDGVPLDQSVNGNDFWQVDYNSLTDSWSVVYNIPILDKKLTQIKFSETP